MHEDRTKSSRERVFLEVEEVQELNSLGINLGDSLYKWVWPLGLENQKVLMPSEMSNKECELPTYSFQELLEKLPKYIDIVPPERLRNIYIDSNRIGKDESGNNIFRHFLKFGFNEDNSFWIGYQYYYFDYESPLYPFPNKTGETDSWAWEEGGIGNSDWIKAVYDLLINLVKDNLCKFS
jgi:hypothetical protein